MSFKIRNIELGHGTMVIDWGWIVLNHNIPTPIMNDPHMEPAEMRRIIGSMEPEKPKEVPLTAELRSLLDTDGDGEISQQEWNRGVEQGLVDPEGLLEGVQEPDYSDEPKTQDSVQEF